MPVAEMQLHEWPSQCSMMPVALLLGAETPTAQALLAEVAVTPARKPGAGLGTRAQEVPFQRSMTVTGA